ncbi:hypothetical protein, partial [Escherichia coli]|uniref:hypothetical protein n=1 Tax=Escherichia coli TaxID=562 RepID=UPI000CB5519E
RMTIDGEGYVTQRFHDAAGRLVKEVANGNRAPGFGNAYFISALANARSTMSTTLLVPHSASNDIINYRYYDGASQLVAQVDGAGYLTETVYD